MQTPFDMPDIVLFKNLSVALKPCGCTPDELLLRKYDSEPPTVPFDLLKLDPWIVSVKLDNCG